MFKELLWLAILFSLFISVGCGGGGSGDPDSSGNTGGTNNTGNTTASATDILGTWVLSCQGTFETEVEYTGTDYTSTIAIFSDFGCMTPSFTDVVSGTYTTGQNVTSVNGMTARELDSTLGSIERTVHTSTYALAFNASNTCGFTDWQVGVAKDITGLDCGGFASGCSSDTSSTICDAANTTTYTIYRVQDNDTTLMYGYPTSGNDGRTAPTRMTTLLTVPALTKQ